MDKLSCDVDMMPPLIVSTEIVDERAKELEYVEVDNREEDALLLTKVAFEEFTVEGIRVVEPV